MSGTPARPTVINMWASWCEPCRAEMPYLNQLAEDGKGAVDVLGIASGNAREQATSYAVEFGLVFPSVLDPKSQVATSQGVPGLPGTVFMNAKGVVVKVHIGPYKSYDDLKKDVTEHLKVTL